MLNNTADRALNISFYLFNFNYYIMICLAMMMIMMIRILITTIIISFQKDYYYYYFYIEPLNLSSIVYDKGGKNEKIINISIKNSYQKK